MFRLMAILRCNAPINVNPAGWGGVRARGGDLTNFNIFHQIPQGRKQKVNQKMSKKPYPRRKNQNKQYYNTISGLSLRFQVAQ